MKLEMDKSFLKKFKKRIEGFQFEVGILDDTAHKNPVAGGLFSNIPTSTYAGGPVRKKSKDSGPLSTGQILIENMKRLGLNLLSKPFEDETSEIKKFTKSFLQFATKSRSVSLKRIENLLQAVVRNPILRQEYGSNKASTADAKGFDRHLFDTGQMFKAIKARARRV